MTWKRSANCVSGVPCKIGEHRDKHVENSEELGDDRDTLGNRSTSVKGCPKSVGSSVAQGSA